MLEAAEPVVRLSTSDGWSHFAAVATGVAALVTAVLAGFTWYMAKATRKVAQETQVLAEATVAVALATEKAIEQDRELIAATKEQAEASRIQAEASRDAVRLASEQNLMRQQELEVRLTISYKRAGRGVVRVIVANASLKRDAHVRLIVANARDGRTAIVNRVRDGAGGLTPNGGHYDATVSANDLAAFGQPIPYEGLFFTAEMTVGDDVVGEPLPEYIIQTLKER